MAKYIATAPVAKAEDAVCTYPRCEADPSEYVATGASLCWTHFELIGRAYLAMPVKVRPKNGKETDRFVTIVRDDHKCPKCGSPVTRDRLHDRFSCADYWCDFKAERAEFTAIVHAKRADIANMDTVRVQAGALVYYIAFGDRIKIGTSANLGKRLIALPHDRLFATEPGGYATEHMRHVQFADCRVNGEWFTRSRELIAHIDALNENAIAG